MTEHDQRIAIAEAHSWRRRAADWIKELPNGQKLVVFDIEKLPDYLHDLNACHEMEKDLTKEQIEVYVGWLWQICKVPFEALDYGAHFPLSHATAAQRAEAFLRVLNLWKD